jgi:O-methyltransferase involved in polyketide biosynthesis
LIRDSHQRGWREGLLIYLPATAQEQLFTGIDTLASRGSHVAVEDSVPLDAAAFTAKVEEERAATDDGRGPFFQLVYNEQCAPTAEWFGRRGWVAVPTVLSDYLCELGRPVPELDSEAGPMVANLNLVSAHRD